MAQELFTPIQIKQEPDIPPMDPLCSLESHQVKLEPQDNSPLVEIELTPCMRVKSEPVSEVEVGSTVLYKPQIFSASQ